MALEPVGQLEEEALKRKKRLEELKRKAQSATGGSEKKIFRNYKPDAPSTSTETAQRRDGEETTTDLIDLPVPLDTIDKEVKDQLDAMKSPLKVEEIDIANLAPRKVDWDLKRNIAKKLEILERRTQKAIAELIRERLKKGQLNMAEAVNVATMDQGSKLVGEDDED